jgi:signal transduction histidine kinase
VLYYNATTHHPPGAGKTVVLALIVAPLVVRRIWPIPVFSVIVVAAIGAVLWHKHLVAWLALLIALFTVAELRSRRATLVRAGLLQIAVVVLLVLLADRRAFWGDAISYTSMIAAALGLGLYSATRRAYLAELHDHADWLERERDQQGALAVAAERARIAREMHDVVAHHLTVMVTLSEAAAASATSPERAAEVMRSVSATGRRALADTRRLLGVLRQRHGQDLALALAPVLIWPSSTRSSRRSGPRDCRPRWRSAGRRRTCPPGCS